MKSLAELGDYSLVVLDNSTIKVVNHTGRKYREAIPCQRDAMIYLHSENPVTLALETPRIKNARRIAREVPEAELDLVDGEAFVYFPAKALDQVAKIARARRVG